MSCCFDWIWYSNDKTSTTPSCNGNHRLHISVSLWWPILVSLRNCFLKQNAGLNLFIMVDSTRSWLLTAIQSPFNHIIWCLIIFIVFTSLTYWFEIMVYLKSWCRDELYIGCIDWFAGGGFRCSSVSDNVFENRLFTFDPCNRYSQSTRLWNKRCRDTDHTKT